MKNFKRFFLVIGILIVSSIGLFNIPNNFDAYASSIDIPVQQVVNTTATLPSSYDLRDDIYIQVENQNPYGICWAYASLTSIETYLALQYDEYYDFSELHLAISGLKQDGEFSNINNAMNGGAGFDNFFTYTQKEKALVLEDEYSVNDYSSANLNSSSISNTVTDKFNTVNSNFYPLAKVNETISFPKFHGVKTPSTALNNMRKSVKQHIMQYGSLSAGIYANNLTHNSKYYKVTNVSYNHPNELINHAISIIGWDDNYNANGAWSNKGAYLCLNSWGSSFGNDGAFYVSYDDYFIEYNLEGVTNATLATQGSQINSFKQYQSNTLTEQFTLTSASLVTFANVVDVSSHKGEKITSINHPVKGDGASFYIKFFDNETNALNQINSISSNLIPTYYSSAGWEYDKYSLSEPLEITSNYMVIISQTSNPTSFMTLSRSTTYSSIGNTYKANYITGFSTSSTLNSWLTSSGITSSYNRILPTIINTDKEYPEVSEFSSSINSYIENTTHIQKNSIFQNQTISFDITNCNIKTSGITFKKIGTTTNRASSFTYSVSGSTLSIKQNATITLGNYILGVPIDIDKNGSVDQTIYRLLEVKENIYNDIDYNITYNLNGGTNNSSNPSTFKLNIPFTLQPATKNGYSFKGWYLDSTYSTPFNFNSLPASNITLYAKFEIITYTITYVTNGGTGNTNPASYNILTNTFTLNNISKLGYSFEGWYSNSSFTGNKITTIAQGSTGNKILYAKFDIINYSITYHLYDGINNSNNPNSYTINNTINLLSPTKEGFKFIGWYTNSTFTGEKVTTINQGSTGNLNLYAKFSQIYTITYKFDNTVISTSNPSTYTYEDSIILQNAEMSGYRFVSWYTEKELINEIDTIYNQTGNLVLYAKFTVEVYLINYVLNGGTNGLNPDGYTIENRNTIELSPASKFGYDFVGWYTNEDLTTEFTIDTLNYTDITVYAKFTPINYIINYHTPEGFDNSNNPTTYTIESATITLQPATKAGYEFINWFNNNNFDEIVTNISVGSTGNINLYAKYDFALPEITAKTNNLNVTYTGSSYTIKVQAFHALTNSLNTLSYQWYKYDGEAYTQISCTSNELQLTDVADSGTYCCEITFTINDTNISNTKVIKVLEPTASNNIVVNIAKKVHNMSNTHWNYTNSLSYNASEQTVYLVNIPEGVSVTYSNNKFTEIGDYTATAIFEYDTDNTTLSNNDLSTLNWSIRKAKVIINIRDIFNENALDESTLESLYDCGIISEYFPSDINTKQKQIEYLGIKYYLTPTSLPSIQTINATTKEFDIYRIIINTGEYRIVIKTLTSDDITSTNNNGFATDCLFTASHIEYKQLHKTSKDLLNKSNLEYIDGITISYTYLTANDSYTLSIPLDKEYLYTPIKVYIIKNNKLVEVNDVKINSNGLVINSNLKNCTFIITHEAISDSNIGLIIAIVLICAGVIISLIMIINNKRNKNFLHKA